MTKKIENLLSPERLRENWRRDKKKKADPDGPKAEEQSVLVIHAKLKFLIEERFKGDEAEVLNLLLDGLKTHLVQRFPETGDEPEEKETLDATINETLNQIEDLVEAFEL